MLNSVYRFGAETLRPWRGAFVYNQADTTLTIRVPPIEATEETTLRPNTPNPFTEVTTLSYQLAERREVTIAIYDLLGRRVETLVDGTRAAGVHQTEWHATGPDEQALVPGVYFCRMTAGAYTGTRKLVRVR